MRHPGNKVALLALKAPITALFIIWLVSRADADALLDILSSARPAPLLLGALLHAGVFLLGSLRWWILLRHVQPDVRYRSVLPSYYLGIFFNNFLPTTMGGDAVRVVHLHAHGLDMKSLISSSIVDRLIGLLVVLFMGAVGLLANADVGLESSEKSVLVAAAGVFLAGVVGGVFSRPALRLTEGIAARVKETTIRRRLVELLSSCQSYRYAGVRLGAAVLLTAAAQSLIVIVYHALGLALGIALPLSSYFAVIPPIILLTTIPISIGGLGIREGSLVAFLVAMGVDSQQVIGLSLVYLAVLWSVSLPGGMFLLRTTNVG